MKLTYVIESMENPTMATRVHCDKCDIELSDSEVIQIAGYDLCDRCFRQLVGVRHS